MSSENIKRLKEITPNLPSFPNPIEKNSTSECYEYGMKKGTCFAWNLFWVPNVSVTRWFNSKGTIFPRHIHDEIELIIVYSGNMIINYADGESIVLKVGDYVYNDSNRSHNAEFLEDTKYITVMIPASYDYPRGEINDE